MSETGSQNAELARLVRNLRRARRAFINAALEHRPAELERVLDESGWTLRRLMEYCGASERLHFSRMYHFFNEDAKVFDSPAVSLDHIAPQNPGRDLASECSDLWLAGRESEMWVDVIVGENIDEPRPESPDWPRGGWTIRGVFESITSLYREKARALECL